MEGELEDSHHRRDGDDAAEPLAAEDRQTGLDGLQGAEVAGLELVAGLGVRRALDGTVDAVSGVADDGVQVPLFADDAFHGAFQGRLVIDIQLDRDNPGGGFLDGSTAGTGIDGDTGLGEHPGGGGADAAAAARQEGDAYLLDFHNSDRLTKVTGSGMS